MAHATPAELNPDTVPIAQTVRYLSAMSNWEGKLTAIAKQYKEALGYAKVAAVSQEGLDKIADTFTGLYVAQWNDEPQLASFAV